MSGIGAPQQHKQSSRKGKKAWRKNVDVTEVQDGLEEYRDEVRLGGPISEKKAEDLFAVDTVGSKEIASKYNLQKPLKVDLILAQRSAVPAVDTRKRHGSGLPDGIYEPASKKRKADWVSKKDVQRLKQTINKTSHLERDGEGDQTNAFDLWDTSVVPTKDDGLEYIPKKKPKVAPATITKAPIPMTATGKPVRSVQAPKGEYSYNPDFDDWNEAIIREGDKEVAAEKSRLAAAQKEAEKQALIEAAAATAGDELGTRTDDESAWEGFETEDDNQATLRKKRPSRKTPAERNKIKRRKEAERLARHERKMASKKVQGDELARIVMDSLVEQPDASLDPTAMSDAQVDEVLDEDGSKLRRRKRGNAPVPEKNLEVVLPDELQDSLRRLKPEGNLLQDRFRNLLVNGKIESRKPVLQPKKKKVKMTEKWTFKDFHVGVH